MKLHTSGGEYECTGRPHFTDPVRFTLPGDKPDVAALGDVLTLKADDGAMLRAVDISGITARRYIDGDVLVCTNTPAPEPVEPEAPQTQISTEDMVQSMLDMDVRLTMLEQGG